MTCPTSWWPTPTSGPWSAAWPPLDVEADSVRRLIEAIDSRFPGAGAYIDKRMAVAVDGEIHQDAGPVALTADSEVYLIPRIGGG